MPNIVAPATGFIIRTAGEPDYPGIARVQSEAPEAAQWPVGDYSNYLVLVAALADGVAGFCAYRQVSLEETELLNFAVTPGYRGKGIAGALLTELCRRVTGVIYLEVAENNRPALCLYSKYGWIQMGLRKGYYEGGKINAVVMKKSSC